MQRPSKRGQIANAAEAKFAAECEAAGKTWIYQPRTFYLPGGAEGAVVSYRPDFYVVEDGCFVEIMASRQAYSYQLDAIERFRAAYPHLRLIVVNAGAWRNGPTGPRKETIVRYRQVYESNGRPTGRPKINPFGPGF